MMDAAREKAIRDRIAELQDEIAQLRAELAAQPKIYMRVYDLLNSGCKPVTLPRWRGRCPPARW